MVRPVNVLVTGASGQLGKSFAAINGRTKIKSKTDANVNINYIFTNKAQLDICDTNTVKDFLRQHKIGAMVNCAAYTDVDGALANKTLAMAVNATAPGDLASICQEHGIHFFHISTDYVFSGNKNGAYTEQDQCVPANTYGLTKLAGEQAVLAANKDAIVIRTSWLFSQFGNNFVSKILDLAKQQAAIKMVNDQTGGPTWAPHLAKIIDKLIYLQSGLVPGGIYHFSGYPWLSRYDFTRTILYAAQEAGVLEKTPELVVIDSQQWPSSEPRPINSRLDNSKLVNLFYHANKILHEQGQAQLFKSINIPFQRDWRLGLAAILA